MTVTKQGAAFCRRIPWLGFIGNGNDCSSRNCASGFNREPFHGYWETTDYAYWASMNGQARAGCKPGGSMAARAMLVLVNTLWRRRSRR
jgi:hypothetical protein